MTNAEAVLEFLKKPNSIYLALFLGISGFLAFPVPWQPGYDLNNILSISYRWILIFVDIISFFLWLTSLWTPLKMWLGKINEERKGKKKANRYYSEYSHLSSSSRGLIGLLLTADRRAFLAHLGDPGTQELLDTGWIWQAKGTFGFHHYYWDELKKFRKQIREDYQILTDKDNGDFEAREAIENITKNPDWRQFRL